MINYLFVTNPLLYRRKIELFYLETITKISFEFKKKKTPLLFISNKIIFLINKLIQISPYIHFDQN